MPQIITHVFAANLALVALAAASVLWPGAPAQHCGCALGGGTACWSGWLLMSLLTGQIVTRILVTGASGFVGRALVTELAGLGYSVRAAMRQPADVFPHNVEVVAVSDLTRPVEWRALLKGIETVVHLAGIAHAGPEIAEDTI